MLSSPPSSSELIISTPPPSSTMAFSFNNDYSSPPHSSDDISLFLRQLLHRSPSSSSLQPSLLAHSANQNVGFSPSSSSAAPLDSSAALNGYLRPAAVDHLPAAAATNAGMSFWSDIPAGVCSNLTSSSAATAPIESDSPTACSVQLRSAENDADDYDCESEEGPEEAQPKNNPLRNSSKRTRAAEVHNQSEKRRRSRINEKMKALQNLIPNSNKTDKASMLDEAIEYLKQLQLQVQVLSMRNGLILHPMCLPGFPGVLDPVQLSQLGLNFGNRDGSLDASIAHTLPSVPSHQCDPSTRPVLDSLPGTITSEAPPFSLQSSMANQLSSFHLLSSSQNICREDGMVQHQLESSAPMPIAVSNFNSQPSYAKDGTQGALHGSNTSHIQLISSNLDGLSPGTNVYDEV